MPNSTIKTIAKEAGVSVATVSKALNNMPDISESTKAHICEIAQKQGYTINKNARELVKGSTYSAGLILPNIVNTGYAKLAQGIYNRLDAANCSLYFNDSGGSLHAELQQTLSMMQKRVGVLVFASDNAQTRHVDEAVRGQLPVIYLGEAVMDTASCAITCDQVFGGRLAARHLFHNGHRRCAVFVSAVSHQGWTRGFIEYMQEHGCKADIWKAPSDLAGEAAGVFLAGRIAEHASVYSGIFAVGDDIALGAMAVFAAAGKAVPVGFSMIGCGDIPAASLALVNLTTLRLPYVEMGIHAGDIAVGWLRGQAPALARIELKPELIKRGTVRCL